MLMNVLFKALRFNDNNTEKVLSTTGVVPVIRGGILLTYNESFFMFFNKTCITDNFM